MAEKKKKKILISVLAASLISITGAGVAAGVILSSNNKPYLANKDNTDYSLPWNNNKSNTTINYSEPIGKITTNQNYSSNITNESNWTINPNEYDCSNITSLQGWQKWPSQEDPWTRQYSETKVTGSNYNWRQYLINNNLETISGDAQLKAGSYKYTDPEFIQYEIRNNQLKKHPAAENMWIRKPTPENSKALTVEYRISSKNKGVVPLGLYCAPGQVVEIKFDDSVSLEDIAKNKLYVNINEELRDQTYEWGRTYTTERMPLMKTRFEVSKYIDPETKTIKIGSVYGGSIVLEFCDFDAPFKVANDMVFEISNVIQTPHYVHNYTTEQEYLYQIEHCYTPTIALTMDGLNILETADINKTTAAYQDKYFVYPKKNAEYIQKSIQLSRYALCADTSFNVRNVTICAQDLVSNGDGCCFQGEWKVEVRPSWSPVFKKDFVFSAGNIWGFIHEINHAFQYGQFGQYWGYQCLEHSWDSGDPREVSNNVLNMLSFIAFSDQTGYRNTSNWSGGNGEWWTNVQNGYAFFKNMHSSLEHIGKYGSMIYTVGVKNYLEAIRASVSKAKHTNDTNDPSTPFNETLSYRNFEFVGQQAELFKIDVFSYFEELCEKINIKLWDVVEWEDWMWDYYNKSKTYPKFTPAANLYASRQFVKNNDGWLDSGAISQPYRVSAEVPTVLELAKYTTSVFNDRNFSNVEILKNPEFGTIELLDNGSVIYTPNFKNDEQIDNFVFSIKDEQDNHYYFEVQLQPSYIINNIEHNVYRVTDEKFQEHKINQVYQAIENNEITYESSTYQTIVNAFKFPSIEPNTYLRWRFWFIPDRDGLFRFRGKWDEKVLVKVDDTIVLEKDSYRTYPEFDQESKVFELKKSVPVLIDVGIYNSSSIEKQATDLWIDEVSPDNINQVVKNVSDISSTSINYKIDKNIAPTLLEYKFDPKPLPSMNYLSYCNNGLLIYQNQDLFNAVTCKTAHNWWSSANCSGADVKPILDGSGMLCANQIPELVIVFDNKSKMEINQIKVKQGNYPVSFIDVGIQDRITNEITYLSKGNKIINDNVYLDENVVIPKDKKLVIRAWKNPGSSAASQTASIRQLEFFGATELNNIYATNNTNVLKFNGKWTKQNIGVLNQESYESNSAGNSFEFTTNNSTYFIIGSQTISNAEFDLYIDNKFIATYNPMKFLDENNILFTNMLFRYKFNDKAKHHVKIVTKDNNPLNIGYVAF